jgi:hypothetical protein
METVTLTRGDFELRAAERHIIEPSFRVTDCESENRALLRQCREMAADTRFDATALPVVALDFEARLDGIGLVVDLLVPNRDKPDEVEWIHIWRSLLCPWGVLRSNGPEYLVRWMRETIANTLCHEVDESIQVRHVRVFDPHRPLLETST